MPNPEIQALPQTLEALRGVRPPDGRVLSVFVDTTPRRMTRQAYLLQYIDHCKALRARLPELERTGFEAAAAQAERYLTDMEAPTAPGLALFTAARPDFLFVTPLPWAPQEDVVWADRPQLELLEQAAQEFGRIAVVLFDSARARLFAIHLGEMEAQQTLEDYVPRKQATGNWWGLAQTRYARHRDEHIFRHLKRTIEALQRLREERPFDHLFLSGPPEAVGLLRTHLPRELRARVAGMLHLEYIAPANEVLHAAERAMEGVEPLHDLAGLRALLDAEGTAHAVIGVPSVLEALNTARVHRLLISAGLQLAGSHCTNCDRLGIGKNRCPVCSGAVTLVSDLQEQIVQRARAQGARVDFLGEEAGAALAAIGGIGAWTRY